jgi:prepilin-type N-terminal cleavage/methylation domain-containing protein
VQHRETQRGFTIIELMIVVAIIAVLAAVVIPSFMKESRRAGAKSEVHPMFAELGTREDQYKTENNAYLAAAACPPSANSQGTDMTAAACATGTDWTALRIQSPESKLKCSYTVSVGAAGVVPNTDALWPTWITATPPTPATGWYFIVATCPSNGYFTASWDSKIRSQDGK